jgi:hypothetical protein
MNKQRPPLTMITNGLAWYEVPEYRCFVSGAPTTGTISWRAMNENGTMANEGGVSEAADLDLDFWDAACDAITA